jgi:hypothetical protein
VQENPSRESIQHSWSVHDQCGTILYPPKKSSGVFYAGDDSTDASSADKSRLDRLSQTSIARKPQWSLNWTAIVMLSPQNMTQSEISGSKIMAITAFASLIITSISI